MPNKISRTSLLELKYSPITCETQFSLHLYAPVAVSTAVGQKLYKPELIETETSRTLLYDELPRVRFKLFLSPQNERICFYFLRRRISFPETYILMKKNSLQPTEYKPTLKNVRPNTREIACNFGRTIRLLEMRVTAESCSVYLCRLSEITSCKNMSRSHFKMASFLTVRELVTKSGASIKKSTRKSRAIKRNEMSAYIKTWRPTYIKTWRPTYIKTWRPNFEHATGFSGPPL